MRINSLDICTVGGGRVADHPSTFAALRRGDPALVRDRVRHVRRMLLRFGALRAEAVAAEAAPDVDVSDVNSEDEDEEEVMARFGMQQGVAFEREEGSDPELQDVLPPWDPAELERGLLLEGSEGEETAGEEPGGAQELDGSDDEGEGAAVAAGASVGEDIQDEVDFLAGRRQELLGQLVTVLHLGSADADEEALAALQEQVASSLPQLASGTDPLTGSRGELDPRQQLRSAAKADSVLAGLVAALQDQERRWRTRKLPALQHDAHVIWREGRRSSEHWREDAALLQGRLLKQFLELLKTHLQSRSASERTLRRLAEVCDVDHTDLLAKVELLRIAALPQQPPAQPRAAVPAGTRPSARQRQQLQGEEEEEEEEAASGRRGRASRRRQQESAGNEDDSEYQEDSWLVRDEDDGEGGGPRDASSTGKKEDRGYTSASEHLDGSHGDRAQQAGTHGGVSEEVEAGAARAWNAAGLRPGETRVLVASGLRAPPDEGEQQQQQQDRAAMDCAGTQAAANATEQQLRGGSQGQAAADGEEQPASLLAPTHAVAQAVGTEPAIRRPPGSAAMEGPADDATSPLMPQQDQLAAAGRSASPPPSGGAVAGALELAKDIMGAGDSSSDAEMEELPPEPAAAAAARAAAAEAAAATGDVEAQAAADGAPGAAAVSSDGARSLEGNSQAAASAVDAPEDEEMADSRVPEEVGESQGAESEGLQDGEDGKGRGDGAELPLLELAGGLAGGTAAMEEDATDGEAQGQAADVHPPAALAALEEMAAVETLRCTDALGLHWATAYIRHRIRDGDVTASLWVMHEKTGELAEYTCYDLAQLRPAVPVVASSQDEPSTSAPAAAVPVLTAGCLRVGACYDFNVLRDTSCQGRAASYVPAILLRKQLASRDGMNSLLAGLEQRGCAVGRPGDGMPGSKVEAVLQRLKQAAEAPGSSATAAAGKQLELTVRWLGGERTLRVTDKDLAQADPLLRCTCSWSAADGLWRVAGTPQPRTSLYMWLTAGLSAPRISQLLGSLRSHFQHLDRHLADTIQRELSHGGPGALQRLRSWFRRSKLARWPCMPWAATLVALQLAEQQKAGDEQLGRSVGSKRGGFGLHVTAGGEVHTWGEDGRNHETNRLLSPSKRHQRRAAPAPAAATFEHAASRLHQRELLRNKLGIGQQALQQQVENAMQEAIACAAEATDDRRLVPLWTEQPEKGPMVYHKIAKVLKPHQREGLQFIWQGLVLDFMTDPELSGGCLLAHHMGLGKTLQTVALLSSYSVLHPEARFLVLVPKVVLHNWQAEFRKWLPRLEAGAAGLSVAKVYVVGGNKPEDAVRQWHRSSGSVLICTHEKFRDTVLGLAVGRPKASGNLDARHSTASAQPRAAAVLNEPLAAAAAHATQSSPEPSLAEMLQKGAEVVVVDEAHVLKNDTTQMRQAFELVSTKRRLALTGYPLQNNLTEMYAMLSWCDPDLMTKQEWEEGYADPIMAGQLPGASPKEVRLMNEKLAVFYDITSRMVHRCGEGILKVDLPPKLEVVLKLSLTPTQDHVYRRYLQGTQETCCRTLLGDVDKLRMICDRPSEFKAWLERVVHTGREAAVTAAQAVLVADEVQVERVQLDEEEEAMGGFEVVLNDDSSSTVSGGGSLSMLSEASGAQGAESGGAERSSPPGEVASPDVGIGAAVLAAERVAQEAAAVRAAALPVPPAVGVRGRKKHVRSFPVALAEELLAIIEAAPPEEFDTRRTSKMWAVEQLLRYCVGQGEKLVLVAESLELLKQVEGLLKELALRNPDGKRVQWCKIEGQTTDAKRKAHVQEFEDGRYQVFLLSKAGTHGINLVSCRRIAMLEEPWNPVYNLQAIARLFRYGQNQGTFVYRMYYNGAVQYNTYLRNVNKVMLFKRVIDRQTVKRAKTIEKEAEKQSVYFYEPDPPDPQGLEEVRRQQDDPALAQLLKADAQQAAAAGGSGSAAGTTTRLRVMGVEDHDKNLAEDPSQLLTQAEKRRAAKLAHKELAAAAAAGVAGTAAAPRRSARLMARLKKMYGEFSEDEEEAPQQSPAVRPALPAQQQQQQQQRAAAAVLAAAQQQQQRAAAAVLAAARQPAQQARAGQTLQKQAPSALPADVPRTDGLMRRLRQPAPQPAALQQAAARPVNPAITVHQMLWYAGVLGNGQQGSARPLSQAQMQMLGGLQQMAAAARPSATPRPALPHMAAAQQATLQQFLQVTRPVHAAGPATARSGTPDATQDAQAAVVEAGSGAGRHAESLVSAHAVPKTAEQQLSSPQKRSREAIAPDGMQAAGDRQEAGGELEQRQPQSPDAGGGTGEPVQKRHRTEDAEVPDDAGKESGPSEPPHHQQQQQQAPHAAVPPPLGNSLSRKPTSVLRRLMRTVLPGRKPSSSTGPSASQSRSLGSAAAGAGGSSLEPQQHAGGQAHSTGLAAHAAAAAAPPEPLVADQVPASQQEQARSASHTPPPERKRSASSDSLLPAVAGSGGARSERPAAHADAQWRSAKKARATPRLQPSLARRSPRLAAAGPPAYDVIDLTFGDD